MDNTTMIIIGIVTLVIVGAFIAIRLYRKKSVVQMFEQISMSSKQVPKNKKISFILLMFTETMSQPLNKSKATANMSKLNNPKYLEFQLLQMSKILKDPSKVTDKKTKQALKLLKEYQSWEEKRRAEAKKLREEKSA
jgi:hypothetical protein